MVSSNLSPIGWVTPEFQLMDFTAHRARSLARLCAYTLLVVFLISLVASLVPVPLADPGRAYGVLQEMLERSTLPLVALLFLFVGLAQDALPAFWEVGLARRVRPLLRLVALGYLLTAMALVALATNLDASASIRLRGQQDASLAQLQRISQGVGQATDPDGLRRLLSRRPGLIQAIDATNPSPGRSASLEELKARAAELLDRAETNIRQASLRRRADASGKLTRQTLRLSLTALAYGLFYLLAGFLWPASLAATIERLLDARDARALADAEDIDLDDDGAELLKDSPP